MKIIKKKGMENSGLSNEIESFEKEMLETKEWFASPRFEEITRLYSPRQVVEQRGTIATDYTVAKNAATGFMKRLRALFANQEQITTFGPYSPGQAVAMRRLGFEGIYLGGWATSAKGSITEDPGPDLANYPLSQVPDEAAPIVRALLTADRNQKFARSRMTDADRKASPFIDFQPAIIADADTGHGGEAHVRNLIRRFVEVGVPGYHIEDQKPGCKKCGHQGGKVLVSQDEQIIRLNAARFQLDIMKVAGIIVARTDAESATFLDGRGDERDQPFILGATNRNLPSYKLASLAVLKRFHDNGSDQVNGHLLYQISETEYEKAFSWFEQVGLLSQIDESIKDFQQNQGSDVEAVLNKMTTAFHETWEIEAGLKTFDQAVIDVMEFHIEEGATFEMTVEEWRGFAKTVSFQEAKDRAKSLGINIIWDCELSRTPEGFYQIQGGIEYAVSKSLAVCPFADMLWMETKTANLTDAKQFADGIHAVYPDKMMAYNLSPSFNWDTTGMTEDEMKNFPKELGKLGFVFNFITYGGHQIDGAAAEDFGTALQEDGMLALARLQRKLRLVNSPYRTPQTLVGGPRMDGALMAASGRTATTKAMGKGSTQHQHLVQTEVPVKLLENWITLWRDHYDISENLQVDLKPHSAGSNLLELAIFDESQSKVADVIFDTIQDRHERHILSIRDQNTYDQAFRQKRLMTLLHLFLIHRYKAVSVHYVSPTDDNLKQTEGMQALSVYDAVNTEIGHIIVAEVNNAHVKILLDSDQTALKKIISKEKKPAPAIDRAVA